MPASLLDPARRQPKKVRVVLRQLTLCRDGVSIILQDIAMVSPAVRDRLCKITTRRPGMIFHRLVEKTTPSSN